MSSDGTPTGDGLVFGPNGSGKRYLCWFQHRGGDRRKSQWAPDLAPVEEYGVFCTSDERGWQGDAGEYWGVRDDQGTALGTRGERLAKFPANATPAVPWHGYPVSPLEGRANDQPPDALVAQWHKDGFVTRTFALKIQRRKA